MVFFMSSAEANRCAGSLLRARITMDSNAGLTLGLICEGGTGSSLTCLTATATASGASKGSWPVAASYMTTPRE